MRSRTAVLAAMLTMVPLGAEGADLVVWWERGYYEQEDDAVREIIAAFEHRTGKLVELQQPTQDEMEAKILAAVDAGQSPDFLFGTNTDYYYGQWAYQDRLVDLSDVIRPFASVFDPDALAYATLFNATTGRRALYALPLGSGTHHLHVWRDLLQQAGFTIDDVPPQWEAFWSFWCDEIQPAVRQATGRDDVYGVGLAMSAADDTQIGFQQFMQAYEANYLTPDGKLIIDDPEIRRRLIRAMDSYTGLYRKGCTPPSSVTWTNVDNNRQFYARALVITANFTLSIPNGLRIERPEDYYQNTATIEWPYGAGGHPLAIHTAFFAGTVFKAGGRVPLAKEFVRLLVEEGWLAHWLDFSAERFLSPMPKLLEQPFWLDPSDPHRMAAVMQFMNRPRSYNYSVASGNPRHQVVDGERVWGKAVYRVAAGGICPEQAVDEAIVRIKQILSE
jgi:multiple sugar transport system substrate-binding protein